MVTCNGITFLIESQNEKVADIDNLPSNHLLFHCTTCGLKWEEHNQSCCQHRKKNYYIALRCVAQVCPAYKRIFDLAKVNGWNPSGAPTPFSPGVFS